jgi:hypothetical protein
MGQEPGTGGAALAGSNNPDVIRQQIEETREELGDTIEALSAKTDVKARVRENPRPAIIVGAVIVAVVLWRLTKGWRREPDPWLAPPGGGGGRS